MNLTYLIVLFNVFSFFLIYFSNENGFTEPIPFLTYIVFLGELKLDQGNKEAVCSCISAFVSSFIVIPVEQVCQIYQKYIPLYERYTDKNNRKLVQMSCTANIVYSFHLSLHMPIFANLRQNRVFTNLIQDVDVHIVLTIYLSAGQLTAVNKLDTLYI